MKKIYTILLLLLFSSQFIFSQEQDLLFHWGFDDVVDDHFNEQINGFHGGVINGAKVIPGKMGNALEFDGVDDYVSIPDTGQTPPQILWSLGKGSISLWFRVDSIPQENGISPIFYYGRNDPCNFFDASNQGMIIEVGHSPIHYASKRLYFTIWSNECSFPTFCFDSRHPIEEGEWYHFVAVVGEDYNTGYLNGELMVDRHYNFGYPSSSQFFEDATAHETLWLGKGYWDGQEMYFKGAIDDVRIYNFPLSQGEVTLLFEDEQSPTSIENRDKGFDIYFYPNPTSHSIIIEHHSENPEEEVQIQILDIMSRVKISQAIPAKKNEIDISDLSEGVYIISFFENDHLIGNRKFVKR